MASILTDSLANVAAGLRRQGGLELPAAAYADPREELIVRYGKGTARFSADRKFLSFGGTLHQIDGTADGRWAGECELVVPVSSLGEVPPPAPPPFNRPAGPVPHTPAQGYFKGTWTFGDGSSLTVVGPALLHTAQASTLESVLWVSANQLIAQGTGRYAGAQGTKTTGVAIWLPRGASVERFTEAPAKTIDVFRVIKQEFIGQAPPPPSPAGGAVKGG